MPSSSFPAAPRSLRRLGALALVAVSLPLWAAACGSAEDAAVGDEDNNVVPKDAQTLFDQAAVCDQTLKRHVSVRATDLAEGAIRWNCADVAGVETDGAAGKGRGQEYCEYHAIQDGKRVTQVADVDVAKGLYCYFTSVYWDVDGHNEKDNPELVPGARDEELAEALSTASNFDTETDPELVRMKISINSRDAASTLIEDCANIEPDVNEERQVACYQGALAASKTNAGKLKKLCRGQDLSKGDRWSRAQKLGAKLLAPKDAGYEQQRDIIGCLSLHRAEHGGVTFRNSDPMICGRVFRAKHECGCEWQALPAGLEGFHFTGWTSDKMPTNCHRVQVDGKAYPHLTVCEVPPDEVAELELNLDYGEDLPKFCNERFAKDIVMKAPLRAVEKPGSCRTDTEFCAAFAGATEGPQ